MPADLADLVRRYLSEVARENRRSGASEASFYPAIGRLLEGAAVAVGAGPVHARQLPIGDAVGDCRPDLQVFRGRKVVGYVEVKAGSGPSLETLEKRPQIVRYREVFPNLLLTDRFHFRLWRSDRLVATAPVGESEASRALFERYFSFDVEPPATARTLAVDLAHRARFLRDEILLQLARERAAGGGKLVELADALSRYLLPGLTDPEFADLYAETLTYGLFAGRVCHTADPDTFDALTAFECIPRQLGILRELFRYITAGEWPLAIDWILCDVLEVLRATDVEAALGGAEEGAEDPIYYFYETFLEEYDPEVRRRRGVYYTPRELVSYIVRAVERILIDDLGHAEGFASPDVTVLDPAAGTFAFLAETARQAARVAAGELARRALLRDRLLPNLCGFEILMAPYVIGHLRMARLFERHGQPLGDHDRLHVYLADALRGEEPEQLELPTFARLSHEAHDAWIRKMEGPITAVIGNPPYRGHSAAPRREGGRRAWIDTLLKDGYTAADGRRDDGYYRAGGRPLGERNPKWLQNDYVKFLRLAQHVVDRQGKGVVGFVTDRGYLDNPTFRGLRESLLGTFDRVYLLDLHGELRQEIRSGERPGDENVFPEIQQGVAVALLVKFPASTRGAAGPARVLHHELEGSRDSKLAWLAAHDLGSTPWRPLEPRPPGWFLDASGAVSARYHSFPALDEIFPVHSVGVVTARDRLATDRREGELTARFSRLRGRSLDSGDELEWRARDTRTWSLEAAWRSLRNDERWREKVVPYLYRPFQLRWMLYADYLVERPRREVMRHMLEVDGLPGGRNLGLIAPRQAKEEPGALVTDRIIGHKALSAFDINYLFPLRCRFLGAWQPNLDPSLLRHLRRLHGAEPTPEEVLGYVYAVLHGRGYRRRYRDALRTGFPRIPFAAERDLFLRLAGLGGRLIDLHLPSRDRADSPVRFDNGPEPADGERPKTSAITLRRYDPAAGRVAVNERGDVFTDIPPAVWDYRMGGYQVLDRWLADAAGLTLSFDEIETFRRTVTALERTIAVEDEIEPLVEAVERPAARAVAAL